MHTIKLIITALIVLFGAYITILNWGCVIGSLMNKRRGIDKHYSTVPIVSIIAAGLAYIIYPLEPKAWVWLIPLVNIGNWELVIGLPIAISRGAFKK
jgi:hypothetical protein